MDTDTISEEIAILFSDIVGSTSLYQEIGDTEAHRLVVECLDTMRAAVESVGGTLLRTVGDAVLAKFDSCDDAYSGAIKMQQLHENSRISVSIGFHWGEAIPNQGDVYGNAVNVAARVAGMANGNEIVVTKEVVDRLSAQYQQDISFLTEINVKGIDQPLGLFRLRWESAAQQPATQDLQSHDQATQIFSRSALPPSIDMQLKLSGEHATITLFAHGDKCSIGRGSENNLQTAHSNASRLHATVTCKQGKYYLEDASSNGTYIIKAEQRPVFVHRETVTLDGTGVITTGFLPDDRSSTQDGAFQYATSYTTSNG